MKIKIPMKYNITLFATDLYYGIAKNFFKISLTCLLVRGIIALISQIFNINYNDMNMYIIYGSMAIVLLLPVLYADISSLFHFKADTVTFYIILFQLFISVLLFILSVNNFINTWMPVLMIAIYYISKYLIALVMDKYELNSIYYMQRELYDKYKIK